MLVKHFIRVFPPHIHSEESHCADGTKAIYFYLCRQETERIMEEVQEGRDSLTYLLALAFFCSEQI